MQRPRGYVLVYAHSSDLLIAAQATAWTTSSSMN